MKKYWKVILGVALGALACTVAVFVAVPLIAQAQSATPAPQTTPGAPSQRWPGFEHGSKFGPGRDGGSMLISATASVTGLTTQEVMTALQGGQSLAQIAESKGKTADEVIKAARTQLADLLKQAVTDGRLTQAQADAKLQQFDQTATQVMNDTGLGQRLDDHHHHGPMPTSPTTPGGSSSQPLQQILPGWTS